MTWKKYTPVFALVACIIVFQLAVSAMNREFYLTQLTMAAYYSLVILGLTVLMVLMASGFGNKASAQSLEQAKTTLAECQNHPDFAYKPGRMVLSLEAQDGRITGIRRSRPVAISAVTALDARAS